MKGITIIIYELGLLLFGVGLSIAYDSTAPLLIVEGIGHALWAGGRALVALDL